MRNFDKPAIEIADQIELLKARGLHFQDEKRAAHFLEAVSFFRLTPYMKPFQHSNDPEHTFLKGTGFKNLTRLYDFDRRLRLLVMDAVERIEVAVRAVISHHMSVQYNNPHWYMDRTLFWSGEKHQELLAQIRHAQKKASNHNRVESYARHYVKTYCTPELIPGWAMIEELSLGDLSYLYSNLKENADKKSIARKLNLQMPLLKSWLHSLTTIRNICAHHSRLWNRKLGVSPELPKSRNRNMQWVNSQPNQLNSKRIYPILCILCYLMRQVSPNTSWDTRFLDLLNEFPEIDQPAMGFPSDWMNDPFWPK